MTIFIATFIIISLAIVGMAIGIIFDRPAIKGSCGGLSQLGLSDSCTGACSSKEKQICAQSKTRTKTD